MIATGGGAARVRCELRLVETEILKGMRDGRSLCFTQLMVMSLTYEAARSANVNCHHNAQSQACGRILLPRVSTLHCSGRHRKAPKQSEPAGVLTSAAALAHPFIRRGLAELGCILFCCESAESRLEGQRSGGCSGALRDRAPQHW